MVSCKQRLQHRCHDLPFLLAFPLPGLVTGVLIIIIIILRVISYQEFQDTINVFVSSTRRRTATETHLCMGSTRSGKKNKSTRDIFFQCDLGPDSQWTSNGLATLLPPDYRRVRLSCFQVKKTGVLILVSGGKKAALTGTLYFAMNHYWSTMFFFFTPLASHDWVRQSANIAQPF